jgi:hypothetical protein
MHTTATPRGRYRRCAAGLLALAVALAACGGDDGDSPVGAAPAADPNPLLEDVPRPNEVVSQSFVGEGPDGASLAVSVGGPTGTSVVAYLCDGDTVGAWFRGSIDDAGTIVATSASGSELSASVTADGLTGEVDGSAFALDLAEPGSGLFRQEAERDGTTYVSGWIVHNDGDVVGTVADAKDQRIVGGGTTDPDGSTTGTGEFASATNPAPASLGQAFACGVNGFRRGRLIRLANQNPGPDPELEARIDTLVQNAEVLGCS